MILPTEKEIIIEHLGQHPYRKINPYLKQKNCLNAKNKEYSSKSIQNIINGITENTIIEMHIFNLVAQVKQEKQTLENLKKQYI